MQERRKPRRQQRCVGGAGGKIVDIQRISILRQAIPDRLGCQLIERMSGVLLVIQCIMPRLNTVGAENFFPDYPIDTLKKYARDLYGKAGKIISVKEVKAENQLRGSFIIEGEKTNIEIYFTLSPENPPLIQAYHIREVAKQ